MRSILKSVLLVFMIGLGSSVYCQETTVFLDSTAIDRFISYCDECADKAELQARRLKNQKVIIESLNKVVVNDSAAIKINSDIGKVWFSQFVYERDKPRTWKDLGFGQKLKIIFGGIALAALSFLAGGG